MLKYLRIAVTGLSLMACVPLVTLWVRSYGGHEFLGDYVAPKHRYEILSSDGKLLVLKQERMFIGVEVRIAYPNAMVSNWASHSKFGVSYTSDGLYALLGVS